MNKADKQRVSPDGTYKMLHDLLMMVRAHLEAGNSADTWRWYAVFTQAWTMYRNGLPNRDGMEVLLKDTQCRLKALGRGDPAPEWKDNLQWKDISCPK